MNWLMLANILYPAIYEALQMYYCGFTNYISDIGNYIDLLYIWGSIAMSIVHQYMTPLHIVSKGMCCITALLAIRRTFKSMTVFERLSPIVTMLAGVIVDLKDFMTFYFIQILLFSLIFGVLGCNNPKLPGKFQDKYWDFGTQ